MFYLSLKTNLRVIVVLLISSFSFFSNVSAQEFTKELVQNTKQGVVSIEVASSLSAYKEVGKLFGTGFIINKTKGIILTNRHIVRAGTISSFDIKFFNGREAEAKLLYYDPWQDFAFLQIDPKEIPAEANELKLRTSSNNLLNQTVLMIGNNNRQDFSILTGAISSIYESSGPFPNQSLRISLNAIGGSSGSPVLDRAGDVIAINYSVDETAAIALPMAYIVDALEKINKSMEPIRKHCGAIMQFYSLDHAVKYTGLPKEKMEGYMKKYPHSFNRTLRVEYIMKGSPAEGKLKSGDIILGINGVEIGPHLYLFEKTMNESTADLVNLKIYRSGQVLEIKVPLYNLQSNKVKRLVEFDGAVFYEPDDYIRILSGASIKSVFLTNIKSGSSFDDVFPYVSIGGHPYKKLYNIIGAGGEVITGLDDLIRLIPKLIKKRYFTLDYINYSTGWYSYDGVYYFNQTPLVSDIKYNDLGIQPTVFTFDDKSLEWKAEKINYNLVE